MSRSRKNAGVALFLFILFTIHYSLFTVSAAEPPKRVVSLAPNITEILFALGVENRIVAVSSFCDYPDAAAKKPKVGGMSNPSLEAVVSLRPDLVLFSIDGNPRSFEERLRSMKISTFTLRTKQIRELPESIRQVGTAVGARDRAERLAGELEKQLMELEGRRPGTSKPAPEKRQKVLFIIWPEPLIVAGPGSIADDALKMLGAINIAGGTLSIYPKYSIEEILRRAPDIIFIGKGKGMDEVSDNLLKRLGSVPAVRNNKVFSVSDLLYRLGPRTVQGVEELAGYLQRP